MEITPTFIQTYNVLYLFIYNDEQIKTLQRKCTQPHETNIVPVYSQNKIVIVIHVRAKSTSYRSMVCRSYIGMAVAQ